MTRTDASASAASIASAIAAIIRRSIRLWSSGVLSVTVMTPSATRLVSGSLILISGPKGARRSRHEPVHGVADVGVRQQRRVERHHLLDAALVERPPPGGARRAAHRQLRYQHLHLARLVAGHEAAGHAQLDLAQRLGVDAPVEQRVPADVVEAQILALRAKAL